MVEAGSFFLFISLFPSLLFLLDCYSFRSQPEREHERSWFTPSSSD